MVKTGLSDKRKRKHVNITWRSIADTLSTVFEVPSDTVNECSIRHSFDCVFQTRNRLMKDFTKGGLYAAKVHSFLGKKYELPKFKTSETLPKRGADQDLIQASHHHELIQSLSVESIELQIENNKLQGENKKLAKVKIKLDAQRKRKSTVKKLNQNLFRCNQKLSRWIKKYNANQDQLRDERSHVQKLNHTILRLRKMLKVGNALKIQNKQYAKKLSELRERKQKDSEIISSIQTRILELEEKLLDYTEANSQSTIKTLQDGKTYCTDIREASYYLQNCGLSETKVSEVLTLVVKTLTGMDFEGPMPSSRSQNRFGSELKAVSLQQVKETLLKDGKETTAMFDGTTKCGQHISEIEIATKSSGTFLIGLKEQCGGKATDYVDAIHTSFSDVEKQTYLSTDSVSILKDVTNSMSDRCVVNKCVEDSLSAKKEQNLNTFKCSVHPLDSMAKGSDKTVTKFENDNQLDIKQLFRKSGESYTQALIKCVGKLFYNDKVGCSKDITAHLKEVVEIPDSEVSESMKRVYHRFVGNRFHIYFLDAGLCRSHPGIFL